ncbi:hypothetical protein CLOM_g12968 [Closterium sp. NIES-68]|nr:hypothetical protein CLOM_g12968 [Closterium sp. NIES-68]GJP61166.1 hypothetical protein CLOP_g18359 [Closterium sp. NIES-67]
MALAARSASDGLLAGKSAGRRALPVLRQTPVSLLCAVDSAASKRAAFHEASNSAVFKAKTSLSAADLLMLLSPTVATSANIGAVNGGPYACRECSNKFPSLHSLDFHYQTYHAKDKKIRPAGGQAGGGGCSSAEPASSGSAPSKNGSPPPPPAPAVADAVGATGLQEGSLEESRSVASAAAAASQCLRSLSPSPSATTVPSSGATATAIAAKSSSSSQQRRGAKRSRADSQPGGADHPAQAAKRGASGGRARFGASSERRGKQGVDAGAENTTKKAGPVQANSPSKVEAQRFGRIGLAGKWQPPSVLITGAGDDTKAMVGDVGRDGGAVTPSDTSAMPPRRIGALAGSCLSLTDRMNSLTSSLTELTAAGSNPVSPTTPTNVPLFGGPGADAAGMAGMMMAQRLVGMMGGGGIAGRALNGGSIGGGSFGGGSGGGGGFNCNGAGQAGQLQQLMALVMQEKEKRGRLAQGGLHQQRPPPQQQVLHAQQQQQQALPPQQQGAAGRGQAREQLTRIKEQTVTEHRVRQPEGEQQWMQLTGAVGQPQQSVPVTKSVVTAAVTPAPATGNMSSFPALALADGRMGASSAAQGADDVAGSQLSMLVAVLASRLSQQKPPAAGVQGGGGAAPPAAAGLYGEMELLGSVKGVGIGGVTAVAECQGLDLDLRL